MPMSKAAQQAQAFADACAKYNWSWSIRGGIITITKQFQPQSSTEFADCDMMYYSLLDLIPRTQPGSDWGTDGGGIGALSALSSGVFTMNRSGCSKRFIAALKKI